MTTLELLANHYEEQALKTYTRQQEMWADDDDMLEMFKGDYHDHLDVAEYVRAGELDRARWKLWMMDTAARDECPDRVYAVLYPAH